MSHDLNGRMTNLTGVYGTLLEDNNLSYSVQTGYAGEAMVIAEAQATPR